MTSETKEVIIATREVQLGLYIIAKNAVNYNRLELQFNSKHSEVVNELLLILRKGFGWLEVEKGNKTIENIRCIHKKEKLCNCPNMEKRECREVIRKDCKNYKKDPFKININFVLIEKAGQIRGM